jgi:hypothetical protein
MGTSGLMGSPRTTPVGLDGPAVGGGRYEEEGSSDWVEGGKSEAWDSLGTRVEEGCEEENAEEGWECCRPPLPSALMTAWTVSV